MTHERVFHADHGSVVQQLVEDLTKRIASLHEICQALADAVMRDLEGEDWPAARSSSSELFAAVGSLTEQPELPILGMGFAPASKSGAAGQELHWWYSREHGRPPQKLLVGAQAGNVSDYEISRSLWWQAAMQSTSTCVVGPYVDVSGTNQYVVTLSRAVRTEGELAGVVAVDVRVGHFQTFCQPLLLRLPSPTSVVNEDGDVIATNSGRLLGGTVSDPGAEEHHVRIPGTDWRLVLG
jgi:hypothetical protein